jgi:aspartate/methionine/tyrosine aminotransferase
MANNKLILSQAVEDISPAMSIKFNMEVYDLQRQGKDVIVLSLGEAFFKLPEFDFDESLFVKGCHYSSSWGLLELRQKISQYYNRYGVEADPEKEILVSAGSKAIIYMVLLSIINPGDEVIILEPAWVSYTQQVKLCYGRPVTVPYHENLNNLEKYITPKTKAIIINNPNNPSGKVYAKEELQNLYNLAEKHGIFILSDEAYSDFVGQEPFYSMGAIDKEKKLSFVINSVSKCLGVSGWRIGYVIADKKYAGGILKVNQHLITCPAALIELCLVKYFDDILKITAPQISEVMELRRQAADYMDEIGLKYFPGSGTFYFMVSIEGSKLGSEEFALKLLREHGVSTVPGVGYGQSVDKFLRVSVGTESPERIKAGLSAVLELIKLTHE